MPSEAFIWQFFRDSSASSSDKTVTIVGVGGEAALVGVAVGIFLGRKSRR